MLPLLVEIKKTTTAAKEIASLRSDAKVLGIGNIDVRKVQNLKEAVDKTVEELGRIDFVIAGAAGNFLCDFNHLSSNAFKSIVDIDLLGSFNTVKATFEQLRKTREPFYLLVPHYIIMVYHSNWGWCCQSWC